MSNGGIVLTPISPAGYATLADLRADPSLKLAAGETADDALLQDLIVRISALIDLETERVWAASTDTTRYFDVPGGACLYPDTELAAITSIVNGDGTTIDAADYVTQPRQGGPIWEIQLKGSSGVSWETDTDGNAQGAIAITGKWAYAVTAPEDIRHATIIGAAAAYRMSLNGDSDRAIIAGGGVVIEPSRLPATFWQIINKRRRLV